MLTQILWETFNLSHLILNLFYQLASAIICTIWQPTYQKGNMSDLLSKHIFDFSFGIAGKDENGCTRKLRNIYSFFMRSWWHEEMNRKHPNVNHHLPSTALASFKTPQCFKKPLISEGILGCLEERKSKCSWQNAIHGHGQQCRHQDNLPGEVHW